MPAFSMSPRSNPFRPRNGTRSSPSIFRPPSTRRGWHCPGAGRAAQDFGAQPTLLAGLAVALFGLPLLVLPNLPAVLTGLALIGVGTFFAQAAATGFVSRAAATDRGSATGLYLASYFLGGLFGSAALGQVFDRFGWAACVVGVGAALMVAAMLASRLRPMPAGSHATIAVVSQQ